MADERLAVAIRAAMDDVVPGDGLRARVQVKRSRRRLRHVCVVVSCAALAGTGIASLSTSSRDGSSVAAGFDDRRCAPVVDRLEATWLPLGWHVAGQQHWSGPDGESVRALPAPSAETAGDREYVERLGRSTTLVSPGDGTCAYLVIADDVGADIVEPLTAGLRPYEPDVVLWPLSSEIQPDVDADRATPEGAVRRFLADVVPWDGISDVIVSQVTARQATVAVVADGRATLRLQLRDVGSRGMWSVLSVSNLPFDASAEVVVTRGAQGSGEIRAELAAVAGAASATLDVRFPLGGASVGDEPGAPLQLSWSGGNDGPTPGRVLVTFLDDDVRPVGVWGVALPSGDYAIHVYGGSR